MTNETKLIRVLDRRIIPTSRGTCRGPIGPYRESLNRILVLISRGYEVVEVLPDNSEVKLTEINFDKDNTAIDVENSEDNKNEEPENNKVENEVPSQEDKKNENAQPPETNRQLSKKERRQKAREQREQQNKANTNNNVEAPTNEKAEDTTPADNVVPESAIEE